RRDAKQPINDGKTRQCPKHVGCAKRQTGQETCKHASKSPLSTCAAKRAIQSDQRGCRRMIRTVTKKTPADAAGVLSNGFGMSVIALAVVRLHGFRAPQYRGVADGARF